VDSSLRHGAGLRDGDGFPAAAVEGGDDDFVEADTVGCDSLRTGATQSWDWGRMNWISNLGPIARV
jgi:hypothetical protein